MKHEWRKKERAIYLPKSKPELIDIPEFQFITLSGKGNPNDDFFSEYIEVLYSVAYVIKMNYKKREHLPPAYQDWTAYPLEGVWDIAESAKRNANDQLNKNDLVFDLMIRQPDFVELDFFNEMIALTKKKKPHSLLDNIKFEKIKEGKSIQMLHLGSYDDEPKTVLRFGVE